jgi:initiation factor 1A
MVKNFGGKGGKKIARKHFTSNNFNAKLRLAEEEGETYACVTKLLGNGMCHVNCLESNDTSKMRLCIIRNKFRGRGKRDNSVGVGTYVLVGVRSWETSREGSLDKCDLIEVYSNPEVEKIKSQVDKKWSMIHVSNIIEVREKHEDDMFTFTDDNSELQEEIQRKIESEENSHENSSSYFGNDEEFDIDDI